MSACQAITRCASKTNSPDTGSPLSLHQLKPKPASSRQDGGVPTPPRCGEAAAAAVGAFQCLLGKPSCLPCQRWAACPVGLYSARSKSQQGRRQVATDQAQRQLPACCRQCRHMVPLCSMRSSSVHSSRLTMCLHRRPHRQARERLLPPAACHGERSGRQWISLLIGLRSWDGSHLEGLTLAGRGARWAVMQATGQQQVSALAGLQSVSSSRSSSGPLRPLQPSLRRGPPGAQIFLSQAPASKVLSLAWLRAAAMVSEVVPWQLKMRTCSTMLLPLQSASVRRCLVQQAGLCMHWTTVPVQTTHL